jgi:phosphoribosylanthranilate isomerase
MKLKICGLKYTHNILQVALLQPDYMGFIFYKKSSRFVGEDFTMPTINKKIKKVGVFVNATEDEIFEKVNKYKLDYVQLHGEELPQFCERISKFVKLIKAFGVDEEFDLKILNEYKTHCNLFLFDTKTKYYGGSGSSFNWNILKSYDNSVPYFIAGGMDAYNVLKLKNNNLNIHAIDVNSKAETKLGFKDITILIEIKNELSGK